MAKKGKHSELKTAARLAEKRFIEADLWFNEAKQAAAQARDEFLTARLAWLAEELPEDTDGIFKAMKSISNLTSSITSDLANVTASIVGAGKTGDQP